MANTGQNFVKLVNPAIVNGTYQAAGTLASYSPPAAISLVNSGAATALDSISTEMVAGPGSGFAGDALAKHGSCFVNLTGTTPVNLSLIDLTASSTGSTGDTVFASWSEIDFINTGAADVTIASGASNPANLGFAGTTPTLTVPAGGRVAIRSLAAVTIDSTHKIVTVTPTAGGSFAMVVGGA